MGGRGVAWYLHSSPGLQIVDNLFSVTHTSCEDVSASHDVCFYLHCLNWFDG